jgi:hypothetical protein
MEGLQMRRYSISALLGLCVTAMASGAYAQEDLQWFGHADEYGASLIYGVPQSGYAPIAFQCGPDGGGTTFVFEFEPINPTDGVKVIVSLEAGDISIPIETRGTRLQMDDLFILEGKIELDDRFTDLLTSAEYLIVFVEDGAEEYPLDGALEAAADVLETCRYG